MTSMILLMLAITATLIVIMLPRIYGDWLNFNQYRRYRDQEMLTRLLQAENLWVKRHFICACAATIMVVALKRHPHLQGYQTLSDVTAVYAMVSLMFAFAESLFALNISSETALAEGEDQGGR